MDASTATKIPELACFVVLNRAWKQKKERKKIDLNDTQEGINHGDAGRKVPSLTLKPL
jgi:hypothetical protein